MAADRVVLRSVTASDERFLLQVYASIRAQELAIVGWDEAQKSEFIEMQFSAQQWYYKSEFPTGDHRIILLNGEPVGRIYTAETESEVRILDVTLLPAYRNMGIGTPLIAAVLSRAQAAGKPVRIYVESSSASLSLFERLGFSKTRDDGLNALLEWLLD